MTEPKLIGIERLVSEDSKNPYKHLLRFSKHLTLVEAASTCWYASNLSKGNGWEHKLKEVNPSTMHYTVEIWMEFCDSMFGTTLSDGPELYISFRPACPSNCMKKDSIYLASGIKKHQFKDYLLFDDKILIPDEDADFE